MHRSRLEMENKELDFHFEIVNVQFNELGRYVLRLEVENPLLEGSAAGVGLLVNGGGALYTNWTTTDVVAQTGLGEIHTVARRKFLFRLPKGYCQNDENHDVRLRIEAFRVTDSSLKGAQKAGEAFFAIYPRTDAPRINVLAKEDEDFYCYSSIMTLLRVQDDALSMHCGRMAYKVRFHETRPPRDVLLADSTPPVSTDQGHIQPVSPSLPPATIRKSTPPPTVLKQQILSPSPIPEKNEPKEGTQPEPLLKAPEESPSPTLVVDHLAYQRKSSNTSLHLSPLEHIPAGSFGTHPRARVLESPPGKTEPTLTSPTDKWHVSRPGKQSITIILHGATDLPALSDGSVPQLFGTVKSGMDEEENQRAQGVTHATAHPTHSPSWEEKVTVEIEEEVAKEEVVILSIADSRSKELLASYCLPVLYLQMFHHYHLELVQPHPSIPSGIRLYVTVVRKGSVIPRQEGFAFTGFEVLLRAVESPLKDPSGPLLAVARIVPDYESYKSKMLMKSPRLAGISVTTVEYPSPKQSSFDVPHHTNQGYPQVSHAGFPQEQPVWDHSFLFQGRDCATIFTVGAALIIEYYCISPVMNTVSWFNRSPVGFSGVPLGQDVYHRLMTENGGRGLRVDGLPVQGTNLRTTSSTTPTVGLVLRLIGSERPDSILAVAHPSRVPTAGEQTLRSSHSMKQQQTTSSALAAVNPDTSSGLHLTKTEERTPPPVPEGSAELPPAPRVKLLKDRVNLPSYDALAQVLPDYEYLFRASSPKEKQKMEKGERQSPVRAPELPETQEPTLLPMKRESTTEVNIGNPEITHHEAQELENYRAAMQKMAADIIKLRKDMAWQEAENSKLRSELSLHQNLGPTLLDDADIDVMTKAEIADRIVLLKQKLASETAEHLKSKDKVQQLQNELIRKNDRETELLRLQKAHQQQHAALQKYQEKIRKSKILENTIRQQETIIEKMENILDKKLKERPRERRSVSIKHTGAAEDTVKKEVEVVLLAENTRLREELGRLRTQPGPIIIQQPVQSIKESLAKSEKLNLLVQLDKAQGRIQTLETLLEENSRKWGREKQSMLTRLSEQEHGFTRTSTMVFHDFPLKHASDLHLSRN